MSKIKELSKQSSFLDWFNAWVDNVKSSVKVKEYKDDKGYKMFLKYVGVMELPSFIGFFICISIYNSFNSMLIAPLIFGFGANTFSVPFLLMIGAPRKMIFSKWTKKGRMLNLKFTNYKRYLSDFSLLKEHPPKTVKLWDYHMTYAVAFGVADKTIKAMKTILPSKEIAKSGMSYVYMYPIYLSSLSKNISPKYIRPSSSSFSAGFSGYSGGSFGGGGFGGGGGGGGAR